MYQKVDRSEHKYYLSYDAAARLQQELSCLLSKDSYSQSGDYVVRSLYFDTVNQQDYFDKLNGYEIRKKIRLRIYDVHADTAKLEMKAKEGSYQHKYSITVSKLEAEQLIDGNFGILLDNAEQTQVPILLYKTMMLGAYHPVVIVEYDRMAYCYHEFNVRITIDKHVRCSEGNLDLFAEQINFLPVMTDYVLLEVKYDKILPKFISNVFKQYHLTEVANSKYCQSRKVFLNFYKGRLTNE